MTTGVNEVICTFRLQSNAMWGKLHRDQLRLLISALIPTSWENPEMSLHFLMSLSFLWYPTYTRHKKTDRHINK